MKFLASLQSDVRRGPRGPRAKPGVLHAELLRLRDLVIDVRPARSNRSQITIIDDLPITLYDRDNAENIQ